MNNEEIGIEELFEKHPHFNAFMKKKDKYILDENNNAIEADLMTWGKFFEEERERCIVKKDTIDELRISTVFLGLDHNIGGLLTEGEHEPHIFETMVFKDDKDIYCTRYSTWKEAEEGHQKAIEWVSNGCIEEEDNGSI